MWMITYTTWDTTRFCNLTTSTVKTDLHPIKWRDSFLCENPQFDGCNVIFAIKDED